MMFKHYRELQDVVSLIIYCTSDRTFLMLKETSGEYWIPSMKSHKYSWKKTAHKMLPELFGLDCTSQLASLRVCKIWLPNHPSPCIFHAIYKLTIKADDKKRIKVKPTVRSRFQWLSEADLVRLQVHHSLRSPELIVLAGMITNDTVKEGDMPDSERGQLIEVDEESVMSNAVDAKGAAVTTAAASQIQLLSAAKYTRDDQLRLFREFVTLCFPALYMSQQVFTQLMLEVGWPRGSCPDLFRAADVGNRGGLSFAELVAWSAATEPDVQHAGLPAELRCHYIFRYYDSDGNQQLHPPELQRLVAEARAARGLPVDTLSVLRDLDLCYKQLDLSTGAPLSMDEVLRLVREMRLRGTSSLLRAPTTTLGYIADLQARDCVDKSSKTSAPAKKPTKNGTQLAEIPLVRESIDKGRELSTVEGGYCLARGVLHIQRDTTSSLLPLNELDDETVSRSALQLLRTSSTSLQLLEPHSLASEALAAVRYFASEINTPTQVKAAWEWGEGEAASLGNTLLRLSAALKPICAAESRLLHLTSPLYVIGDLHGNLDALLTMEAALWDNGGALAPAGLLFLGDYVDRGSCGAELLAFLFACKLQRPRALHLVRGNHETRDVQTMFTFFSECKTKFGDTEGVKVWEAINDVFDVLPLAAVVDGKVFCCHGGIPPPWVCARASAIERIPVPLPRPAHQSHLAWELLWNDPITPERVSASLAMELAANDGFAANPRRGTGHVFEQRALDRFLLTNGFSHVVRAHQLHHNGFMREIEIFNVTGPQCQLQGKLITVFSSSHYCGGANDCGAVLLAAGKIRLIRLAA